MHMWNFLFKSPNVKILDKKRIINYKLNIIYGNQYSKQEIGRNSEARWKLSKYSRLKRDK